MVRNSARWKDKKAYLNLSFQFLEEVGEGVVDEHCDVVCRWDVSFGSSGSHRHQAVPEGHFVNHTKGLM